MEQKREIWIDYLKAVACLSVITFHVIYGMQNAGLECSWYFIVIKQFCGMYQIPLFMFASGYLYGKKNIFDYKKGKTNTWINTVKNYLVFVGRKILNLGVPYVVFSIVYFVINTMFSSSVNFSFETEELYQIYKTPLVQYWYIFALLLLFIFVPILEQIIKNEFILLGCLSVWKIINMYWISINNYDYYFSEYALFFYIGTIYARHGQFFAAKKETKRTYIPICFLMLILFFSPYVMSWGAEYALILQFCSVLCIYLAVVFFEKFSEKIGNKFLKMVSKYSFQIYLLHTMATAATRIILVKMGMVNDWIQVILGILVGLGSTLLVAFICEKTVILNFFFFPEATIKKLRMNRE